MANIKVHLLNFHSITSHIELVLENTSIEPRTYYSINRWGRPDSKWSEGGPSYYIGQASSTCSFYIQADPDDITRRWEHYWNETRDDANVVRNNCAVAVQWFLSEFTDIPSPGLSNISFNYMTLGIIWPSFIPFPVTIPGRIMSNVEFYVEARTNPKVASQYTHLFLYSCLALSALTCFASMFTLALAIKLLSDGLAGLAIVACTLIGSGSFYGFFKTYNTLSAKNYVGHLKKQEENGFIFDDGITLLPV